jgi:hypothetical protein
MTPEQHSTSSSGWGDTTSNVVADVIGIVASGVVKLETTPDDFDPSDAGVVVPLFAGRPPVDLVGVATPSGPAVWSVADAEASSRGVDVLGGS